MIRILVISSDLQFQTHTQIMIEYQHFHYLVFRGGNDFDEN